MSDHVLLNLLNELRKRDKMQGFNTEHFIFFSLFNNIGARMLDALYPMTFKLVKNCFLGVKCQDFAIYYAML